LVTAFVLMLAMYLEDFTAYLIRTYKHNLAMGGGGGGKKVALTGKLCVHPRPLFYKSLFYCSSDGLPSPLSVPV